MKNLKQASKKVLSIIVAFAVILCSVTVSLATFADNTPAAVEPYLVSWGAPAIPLYEGTMLDLSTVDVQLTKGGEYTKGTDIAWALPEDSGEISLNGNILVAKKAGPALITANGSNVWVLVNEKGDSTFYLENMSFKADGSNAASNAANWLHAKDSNLLRAPSTSLAASAIPSGNSLDDANTKFANGYMQLGNIYGGTDYYLFNSEILKDFADYTMEISYGLKDANGNYSTKVSIGLLTRATYDTSGTGIFAAGSTALALYTRLAGGVQISAVGEAGHNFFYNNATFHTLEEADHSKITFDAYDDAYVQAGVHNNVDARRVISAELKGDNLVYTYNGIELFNSEKQNHYMYNYGTSAEYSSAAACAAQVGEYSNVPYTGYATDMETANTGKGTVGVSITHGRARIGGISVKLNSDITVPAQAKEIYVVSDAAPAIPAFVNTKLDLNSVLVEFDDGTVFAGGELDWALADAATEGIYIENKSIKIINKGKFILNVSKDTYSKTVYLIVNDKNDYNFKIIEENLKGTDYVASNWVYADYGVGNGITAAGSFTNKQALPSSRNLASGIGQESSSWGNVRLYMYQSDILADFSDFTVDAKFSNKHVDQFYRQWINIYVRGAFDKTEGSTNVFDSSVKQLAIHVPAMGGVLPYASGTSNAYPTQNTGSSNKWGYHFNTLTDTSLVKHTTTDASYVWSNSTLATFDDANANNQPRSMKIVLDGSRVVYSIDNHEIFDSEKPIKQMGFFATDGTGFSTERTYTEETVSNDVYETFMSTNGLTSGDGMFGFAVGRAAAVLSSFTVSLNFAEGDLMPTYEDYEAFTVTDEYDFIPMTEGTVLLGSDMFFKTSAGKIVPINSLDWAVDNEGLTFDKVAATFTATKAGTYKLTAGEESFYIVVRPYGETGSEYTVLERDYRNAGATVDDVWSTYIVTTNGATVKKIKTGSANIATAAMGGLRLYNGSDIEAGIAEINANSEIIVGGNYLRVVSVIEDELVNKLSDYKISATINSLHSGRNKMGLIGRVDLTEGSAAAGMAGIALGSQSSWDGDRVVYTTRNSNAGLSSQYGKVWYQIHSSSSNSYSLHNYTLTLNGENLTYETLSTDEKITRTDAQINAGAVGIVNYDRYYANNLDAKIAIYDFKVTVSIDEAVFADLKTVAIEDYVSANGYRVIENPEDFEVNEDGNAIIGIKSEVAATVTGPVIVKFPAEIGGVQITELGRPLEGTAGSAAYNPGETYSVLYNIKDYVNEIDLTNFTTEIGIYPAALGYCSVEKIILPNKGTVTAAGAGVKQFAYNTKLLTVENTDALVGKSFPEAFISCSSLAGFKFPSHSKFTSIGYGFLYNCWSVGKIWMSDAVTYIGSIAFSGNSSLHELKLSKNVATIENGAIGTNILSSVTIENSQCYIMGLNEEDTVWGITTAGLTVKGYAGSTAETYVERYNAAHSTATPLVFEPLDAVANESVSKYSVYTLPKKFAGLDVAWDFGTSEAVDVNLEGTQAVFVGEVGTVVTATGTYAEETNVAAPTLNVTITAFDASNTANIISTDDAIISLGNMSEEYVVTFPADMAIDYSTLKVNGKYAFTYDATGNAFTFEVVGGLPATKLTYEIDETVSANTGKFYNLGAGIKGDNAIRFGTLTTSIIKNAGAAVNKETILVDGVECKPLFIGALVAPAAIASDAKLTITDEQMQALIDADTTNDDIKVEVYAAGEKKYYASHVAITSLNGASDKFADYGVALTGIPASMKNQEMMYRSYMICEMTSGGYIKVYGDVITRSYSGVQAALAQ